MKTPEDDRLKVKEVTMDLSESMRTIVEAVFLTASEYLSTDSRYKIEV